MALLSINNVDMPKPTTYQVGVQDLDSAESVRSESGVLHRDRVRAGVRKLELGWTVRTAESSKILKAVSGESFTILSKTVSRRLLCLQVTKLFL